MRATRLLAENIAALLRARGHKQGDLAVYCGHSDNWIHKVLAGKQNVSVDDFDKVADFFGIAAYQLLQPGISPLTERRKRERRSGRERRVGHAHRAMLQLQGDIEAARPRRTKADGG